MYKKTFLVKNNRNSKTYRYKCTVCGKETDSSKRPKNCNHNLGYNIDRVWANILRSALGIKSGRKRLKIDIDKKYIVRLFEVQNEKCAISGLDIKLGINASLDRKDSSLGYTKGNVQWVHKDINIIKGSFSEEYFIEVCTYVKEHNRSNT